LKTDLSGAETLLEAEDDVLDHLNRDHSDALALYATRLAGARAGAWQASGVDPEGLDLVAGDRTTRIVFPDPVQTPGALREMLRRLADQARSGHAA
jgi:putative heme iron utilization protein